MSAEAAAARQRAPSKLRALLAIGLLTGLTGVALTHWAPAESLENTGLGLLFLLRGVRTPPPGVCVVAIDDDSYDILGCPPGEEDPAAKCVRPNEPWPRPLHGDLVRVLKDEGARAVAFDVLMDTAQSEAGDAALAQALAETKIVVLGSNVHSTVDPRFVQSVQEEPIPPLAAAAAVVADVGLPKERDGVIRQTWLMRQDRPSLALGAWETATGDRTMRLERGARLIDYYGPGRTIPTISLYQALAPREYLPPGFFKDKIVFVGLSQPAATGRAAKDSFATPFSSSQNPTTFGVEIHATIAANLVEGRRIDLLGAWVEGLALLLLALAATAVFVGLRPVWGVAAFLALEGGLWAGAWLLFARGGVWPPLIIPSVVQLPTAYVLSLVWYYLTTVREREQIRRAFNFYLSPEMIERIVADPSSLNLGGEEVVATALFTDVAGFTSIAESMPAPATASLLNVYFSRLTRSIFTERGTLIKFIGDAVFAIWGAPLRMEDHAARACAAGLAMARGEDGAASPEPGREPGSPQGPRLVTRIGIHTGPMLVGNLGSEQRFDYTAIGDAVNLASRLEGLNKYFHTRVIVSGDTIAQTGGQFVVRSLGPRARRRQAGAGRDLRADRPDRGAASPGSGGPRPLCRGPGRLPGATLRGGRPGVCRGPPPSPRRARSGRGRGETTTGPPSCTRARASGWRLRPRRPTGTGRSPSRASRPGTADGAPSEGDVRVVLVGGADPAEPVEHRREQVEEPLEARLVRDDPHHLEAELVHAVREPRAEPPLVVLHREVDRRLAAQERSQALVLEEMADLRLVVRLDDELLVELREADLDVLHAELLAEPREGAAPVDPEAESAGIDVRSTHPRVHHVGLAGAHRVGVERDVPLLHVGDHLRALPESAVDPVGPDLGGELPPDLVLVRPKPASARSHPSRPSCRPEGPAHAAFSYNPPRDDPGVQRGVHRAARGPATTR